MTRSAVMAVALALMGADAAAADWRRSTLPGPVDPYHGAAPGLPGEAVVVQHDGPDLVAVTFAPGSDTPVTSPLATGRTHYPVVASSTAGGTVAAWTVNPGGEFQIAERPPEGGALRVVKTVAGGRANYSYNTPLVDVNERGDAIVAYLAENSGSRHEVHAVFRPAGGEFGEPELVGGPAPQDALVPRDVELGPDGTAAVGYVQNRVTHVAVREPGAGFGAPQALGGQGAEQPWRSPQVGVGPAGGIVALWVEQDGPDTAGPVRLAFRPAGAAAFGAPVETGVTAASYERLHLGVSAIGEVLAVVESTRTDEQGRGLWRMGLFGMTGNVHTGRISAPVRLGDIWENYPSFGMNARGDAVLAHDACCPWTVRARRRAPLGGFGPLEDLQPPVEALGPGQRLAVRTAGVDGLGNAQVTFEDGETAETLLVRATPPVSTAPPEPPPLGDLIAPVLDRPPEAAAPDPPVRGDAAPAAVASSYAAPPAPAAPLPRRADDRAAPGLRLSARRLAGRRVAVRVRCDERCRVAVAGVLRGRRVGPLEATLERAGSLRLRLRAPRRPRTGILRLHAVAVDAGGNTTARRASVPIR